jgi:DNA-binding NtrC family response regulator
MTSPRIALFTASRRLAGLLDDVLQSTAGLHHCRRALQDVPSETERVRPDALVMDFTTATSGGHAEDRVLEELQRQWPDLPVVMLTGDTCPEPLARRTACSGLIHVSDREPWHRLLRTVRNLCESVRAGAAAREDETAQGADVLPDGITQRFETNCSPLLWMLQELDVAARHDVTVLLIGETGVGKTYLARMIHDVSPRRDQPFLHVACGALPGDLLESELFGHAKGAFTGAHADKDGKFVAAGNGTILLDEIDVLGLDQQVKLLRVIETGEFEPLGSNKTLTRRARLVVASNLDLQPLVNAGRFRADLFYRLNMMKFELIPLRERPEDVPILVRKLVGRLSGQYGVMISRIDDEFFAALQRHPWPGNVRELENVLRRAVIFCREGVLRPELLPRGVGVGCPESNFPQYTSGRLETLHGKLNSGNSTPSTLGGQIETTEREIIRQTLAGNNQSRTKTARQLGISRVTLYNKMRKYGIA